MKKIMGLPVRNALFFLAAFLIAFTSYCFIWPNAPLSALDSPSYIDLGIKLKNNQIDSPHYRTIGYPLFLLITNSIPHPIRATFYIQTILHFICIWLLAYIVYRLNNQITNYLLNIFCIILLIPPYVESSGYILTENLSQFTLSVLFVFMFLWYKSIEVKYILFAGLFCAFSFLVKPTYIILVFALLPLVIIYKHRQLKKSDITSIIKITPIICLLILPMVSTIGGYYCYNYIKFGYLGITPRVGFQLFTKTIKFIEEIPDSQYKLREALITERNKSLLERGSSHTGVQYIFGKSGRINKFFTEVTGKKPEELDRKMLNINLYLIFKKPIWYFSSVIESFSNIWLPSLTNLSFFNNRFLQLILSLQHFIFVGLFFLYLAFYMVREILKRSQHINIVYNYINYNEQYSNIYGGIIELTAIIIIFYTAVISSALDVGDPRHLQPTYVLIWFLIINFIGQWRKINKRNLV